jgi:hypothetical protein
MRLQRNGHAITRDKWTIEWFRVREVQMKKALFVLLITLSPAWADDQNVYDFFRQLPDTNSTIVDEQTTALIKRHMAVRQAGQRTHRNQYRAAIHAPIVGKNKIGIRRAWRSFQAAIRRSASSRI